MEVKAYHHALSKCLRAVEDPIDIVDEETRQENHAREKRIQLEEGYRVEGECEGDEVRGDPVVGV